MVHKLIIEAIDTANREHLEAAGINTLADHNLEVVETKFEDHICFITLSAENDDVLTGQQTYEYDRFDLSEYGNIEVDVIEENEECILRAFLSANPDLSRDVLGNMVFEEGVAIISAKENDLFWYGQAEFTYTITVLDEKSTVEEEYPNTDVVIEEP